MVRGANSPKILRTITEQLKQEHKCLDGGSERKEVCYIKKGGHELRQTYANKYLYIYSFILFFMLKKIYAKLQLFENCKNPAKQTNIRISFWR